MIGELPLNEILAYANSRLTERSLQPVSRRTLDYWISAGLIEHPRRKGKAGRGFLPEAAKLQIVHMRELQERFNFTLAEIRAVLANGSELESVLNLLLAVENTYGHSLVPYARAYACAHPVSSDPEEVHHVHIVHNIDAGDQELTVDQVAELLETDTKTVSELANSRELPSHGVLQRRFLKNEIIDWKIKNSPENKTPLTSLITQMINLHNELRSLERLDGATEKSRGWLLYWVSEIDTELWRMRRLCHVEEMKQKNLSQGPGAPQSRPRP